MSREIVGLTGATGFVGRNIVQSLLEEGYHVHCLVREPSKAEHIKAPGVTLFKGDVTEKSSIDPAFLSGVSYLIHLVGIISEAGTQTFKRVHFEGTKNIVDLAHEQGGIKKYVQMSALGTRSNARSQYHRTKWQAEEYVRVSELSFTVLRPSLIFGPDGEFIRTFADVIRKSPVVPAISSGGFYPVHVRDVASCFVKALTADETNGKTVPLGGRERLTLKEIIETLCRLMGKKRVILPVPAAVIYPPALLMQSVLKRPPITPDQLRMLGEDNTYDIEETKKVFPDFNPIGFEEGLREFIE